MKRAMKAGTLKLCLPLLVMTAHQNAVSLIVPPFFQQLGYPVSAIGTLISVAWIFTFAARLPSGLVYKPQRARILLVAYLVCMALSSAAYSVATQPVHLALVQAFNGFANGGATTVYFAFFVDALPVGENRHHAMGYYAGALAVGYSLGGFATGYVADRLGYAVAFWFASLIVLGSLSLFLILARPVPLRTGGGPAETMTVGSLLEALKSVRNPAIATDVVVALFLNMLHQIGSTFFPLYGLAVGLTLTQVGVIRASYSLCNAVTRPLSGFFVSRLGHRNIARVGLPLQAGFFMLFPLFHDAASLLSVSVLAGFVRAVVVVANTIGMVEDMEATRLSRGVASGIFNGAGDLGFILGPGFSGLIASFIGVTRLFVAGPLVIASAFLLSLWSCKLLASGRGSERRFAG